MEEVSRLYFTPLQAANVLGVNPSAVRYWLKEYGIEVKRNNYSRKIRKDQVDQLMLIKTLTKQWGLKHDAVRKYIKQNGWKINGAYVFNELRSNNRPANTGVTGEGRED